MSEPNQTIENLRKYLEEQLPVGSGKSITCATVAGRFPEIKKTDVASQIRVHMPTLFCVTTGKYGGVMRAGEKRIVNGVVDDQFITRLVSWLEKLVPEKGPNGIPTTTVAYHMAQETSDDATKVTSLIRKAFIDNKCTGFACKKGVGIYRLSWENK